MTDLFPLAEALFTGIGMGLGFSMGIHLMDWCLDRGMFEND